MENWQQDFKNIFCNWNYYHFSSLTPFHFTDSIRVKLKIYITDMFKTIFNNVAFDLKQGNMRHYLSFSLSEPLFIPKHSQSKHSAWEMFEHDLWSDWWVLIAAIMRLRLSHTLKSSPFFRGSGDIVIKIENFEKCENVL